MKKVLAILAALALSATVATVAAQTGNPAPDTATRLCDLEALAGVGPYDECVPPTTTTTAPPTTTTTTVAPTTTTTTTTTVPPTTTTTVPPTTTTTAPPTTTTTVPPASGFFEDFSDPASLNRFEFHVWHRDTLGTPTPSWPGDHDLNCGAPTTQRTVLRSDPSTSFYRCVNHLMTSVGDTSGYSIASVTPLDVFTDVTEVRWDQNITDLGNRQWTEIKVIPAAGFDPDDLPCALAPSVCQTSTVAALGASVWAFDSAELYIDEDDGGSINFNDWDGVWPNDPARDSLAIRREAFFRDNGDGTLTAGLETESAGVFHTYTRPGSFPTGPVRVVFADHNYTPDKAYDLSGTPVSERTYTWHWDNLEVN